MTAASPGCDPLPDGAGNRGALVVSPVSDPCIAGPVARLAWQPESRWPIVYASASVAGIFGYQSEQMLSQRLTYMSLIHPDDLDRVTAEVVRHLNAGLESWTQSYRILCPDGRVRWLYDLRVLRRDEWGAPRLLDGYVLDETDRRAYEEGLQILAEASPEPFWIADPEGLFYANPTALRLSGHELDTLKGLSWRDLIAPREHSRLTELFAQIETGRSVQTELWVRRADQSETLVELQLQGFDGRLLAIGRGVGRVDAPSRAHESGMETAASIQPLELIRVLIHALPDLGWLKDPQGVYLACNARFESFFGVPESEIIGHTDADFVAPERASLFRHDDCEALRSGRPIRSEERIIFAGDGHEELFESTRIPLRTPAGDLIGVLGIARDLTDHHRLQGELHELRAIYQAILEQATDSIVLIHAETLRFVAFNEAAHQTLGYTRDEFGRLGIPDIQADLTPRGLAYWRDRINCAGWGDLETIHRHKNGELHPVAVTNRRVETRQGPCWVAIWRDLTERKRLNAELAAYRERLDTLVESRIAEIERTRLQAECECLIYRQMLVAFNQAISQALAASPGPNQGMDQPQMSESLAPDSESSQGLRHSAVTPLEGSVPALVFTGVTAGMTNRRDLLEIAQGCLQWLAGEAERAAASEFAVRSYLERLVRLLGSEAMAKGIQLNFVIDPELPQTLRGDAGAVERLLFDLTAQAIALSPPGRIYLRARFTRAQRGMSFIRFEIEGTAIPRNAWPLDMPADPLAALLLGEMALHLASSRMLAKGLGGELGSDPLIPRLWLDLPLIPSEPIEGAQGAL